MRATAGRQSVRRPGLLAVGGTGAAWAGVAALELFWLYVANLWIIALVIYAAAYVIAVAVTIAAAVCAGSRRATMTSLAVAVAAASSIVAIDWHPVFVHGNYRLHRNGFAAVAALAEQGRLDSGDYYGTPLPLWLRHLSVSGDATRIDTYGDDDTGLFLPIWQGIPDGAIGYAYFGDVVPEGVYDCFADGCRARWYLGDGWYWME